MKPAKRWVGIVVALLAVLGAAPVQASLAADQRSLSTPPRVVSPVGPYTTIAAALAEAEPGAVIEVRGGVYPALVVDKPVTLQGVDWPVIDGGGQGTVVQIDAPGVIFRGFEVRGSGDEPDRDHSGVIISASDVVVENNRFSEVLFGVFVSQADRVVVRGNDITGKAKYDAARRGDAIRLWYAADTLIEANTVHAVRDVVVWYSRGVTLRENTVTDARYGIHLMYADDTTVERNRFLNNAVGIYTMYSKRVRLAGNEIRGQRGPSGYALGFKDADDVTVVDNLVVDNRGGLFIDAAPFGPQGYARFTGNVFAFNDVGAILLTSTRRAEFTGNTFWENLEQVAIHGGGDLSQANTWRDNFWSDYAGFDLDGDGAGDAPYHAERFFEGLTDREPLLRALIYSPAAQAIEFAGAAMPIFRPQPKLTDPTPRMRPADLAAFAVSPRRGGASPVLPAALLLLGVGAVCALSGGFLMSAKVLTAESAENTESREKTMDHPANAAPFAVPTLSIQNVTKRYGRVAALEDVSFTAQAGEAIALWGANGAGKTTLIKALLGLVEVQGVIRVAGHDVRRADKAVRRQIGYVPQDVAFYEQSVEATLTYFARLKSAPLERVPALLARLGLDGHARKLVSALSGGLRQRLALAVALLADPPVLLLDEPTANLDAQAQRDYLALLASLCQQEQKTVLFASHRLEEVELLAQRVVVLEHGRVVKIVSPAEWLTDLMPYIKLTLWVPEAQRPDALARFTGAGFRAHLNGRGTVVVEVRAEEKLALLRMMSELTVQDFEMERGGLWK